MRVRISEMIALKRKLKEINSYNLSDIDWIDDNGNKIEIDPKNISDFKYVGLNNIDFIDTEFYKHGFTSTKTEEY